MSNEIKVAFPDGHEEVLLADRIRKYQARDGRAIFWMKSGAILDLKVGESEAQRVRECMRLAWRRQNAEKFVDEALQERGLSVTDELREELIGYTEKDIDAALASRAEGRHA